ncbi:MAG: hypothetical protein VR65_07480 [Desulfobulbaceae bacterium BRH_c16a]|nr:MAG: hypothetical protein VR65_07480 [Desulfobulbaceae bacterium BRH_c16a]
MIPIHKLLSRIRWDPEFGGADFKIGYYDRIEDDIVIVPMKRLSLDPIDHFSFAVYDDSDGLQRVPLHRIRRVYRNDELIWERPR